MNTLIESINKITKIKSDLNEVLRENGLEGGDVFTDYPDKFRELFRVYGVYVESTVEGYTPEKIEVITEVPNPTMSYYQNIVTINCELEEATIYYWIKTDSGKNEVGTTALKKGSTVTIEEPSTVFCYAQYRAEKSGTVSIYVPWSQVVVPEPPRITRVGITVTIEKFGDDDVIYYNTGSGYTIYNGALTVARTVDVYAFTQNYRGRSNTVYDEAPEKPVVPDVPELSFTPNILTITCATPGATIYYKKTTDQYWAKYNEPVTISSSGFYIAKSEKDGVFSDESDTLYCNYVAAPDDPTFNVTDNVVYIVCGTAGATVYYKIGDGEYQVYSTPITLTKTVVISAYAEKQGIESNTVTQTCTYVEPVVPTPPADPEISCSNNIVTITCSTDGAKIYYRTVDGGAWNEYTGPIDIYADTTFWAYAAKNNLNSEVVSQECTYVEPVTPEIPAVPAFSCTNNTVSITCETVNATIYYRNVNDSAWTEYTEPFTITETTQFVAYSYKNGQQSAVSEAFTATYVPIVIPSVPTINCNNNVVYITCDTEGATIWYKINDGSWNVYVNSFSINTSITVYAKSELNGIESNMISQYCEYVDNVPIDEYDPEPANAYYSMPLTIQMIESGYILYSAEVHTTVTGNVEFEYSLDNINWIAVRQSDMTITYDKYGYPSLFNYMINVNNNSIVRLRCTSTAVAGIGFLGSDNIGKTVTFKITGQCNVYGNLLSLVFNDGDYEERSYHMLNATMRSLFKGSDIVNASNLIIPKYVGGDYCFDSMFMDCVKLLLPPKIKHIATTLESGGNGYEMVFYQMFRGCTNMTSNPVLPTFKNSKWDTALTLMFYNCTSLKSKVNIIIGTSDNIMKNYRIGPSMFRGCDNLSIITINCNLTSTQRIYVNQYLNNLFYNMGGSGTVYCTDSNTTSILDSSSLGLSSGWTIQNVE